MIVKMKHLDLLCLAAEEEATLKALRGLGAVHLDFAAAGGVAVAAAKGEAADAEKAVNLILKAREASEMVERRAHSAKEVLEFDSERTEMRFKGMYPGYATYRTFDNPYFKVTVGDFRTRADAQRFASRLTNSGAYRYVFVVKEQINFPGF